MFEVLPFLVRGAVAVVLVLIALQAESSVPKAGCLSLSAALYIYLIGVRNYWLLPTVSIVAQSVLVFTDLLENSHHLSFLPFLLNVCLLLLEPNQADDAAPDFAKCEREIRKIFWQHDRAKLHLVDGMLQNNRGSELALLRSVRKEYGLPVDDVYGQGLGSSLDDDQEEVTIDQIRNEIIKLVRQKDPSKERYVDRLMADYRGRERLLVQELFREYRTALPAYLAAAQQERGSYKPWTPQQERVMEEEKLRAAEAVKRNLDAFSNRSR